MKNKVWLLITFLLMGCSNGNSVSTNNISSSSSTINEISSSIFQSQIYLLEEINLDVRLTREGNYYYFENYYLNLYGPKELIVFETSQEFLDYFNSDENYEKIDNSIFDAYENLFTEYNVCYKLFIRASSAEYKCEFIDNLDEGIFRFTIGPFGYTEEYSVRLYFGIINKSLMQDKIISSEYLIIDKYKSSY